METPLWLPRERQTAQGSKVTRSRIVEAIDRRHPETLGELSARLDITEDYLSRQVRELKDAGVVRKGYVVDRQRVYDVAPSFAEINGSVNSDREKPPHTDFVESLRAFTHVITDLYEVAHARFRGDAAESSFRELEAVAERRHEALLEDLKSYCLTSRWPGNRVAADVAAIAARLEQVGTHASLVAEVLTEDVVDHAVMTGVFRDDFDAAFENGASVGEDVAAVLFDADFDRMGPLTDTWTAVRRTCDELLDRVIAQEAEFYGPLTAAIRSLQRAVRSWVRAAELALALHSGLDPDPLVPA